MAEHQSEKSPFKSRWGGGWVSPVQFLAEGMCGRVATRDRRGLYAHFWDSEKWAREYKLQTIHASRLLKLHSIEAILAALRTTRGKQVYSLGLKSVLLPIIKDEQERLNRLEVKAQIEPKAESLPAAAEQPRPAFVEKPSLLSKLRGL